MESTLVQTLLASFQPEIVLPTLTFFRCCTTIAFNGGNSYYVLGCVSVITLVLTTVWTFENQSSAGILQCQVGGIELQRRWGFICVIINHLAAIGDRICQKQKPTPPTPQHAFDVETAGLICESEVLLIRVGSFRR